MQLSITVLVSSLLVTACGSSVAHDEATSPDGSTQPVAHDEATSPDGSAQDEHAALLDRDAQLWCEKDLQCGWPVSVAECTAQRRANEPKCMPPDDKIKACLAEVEAKDCETLTMISARSCLVTKKSPDGC
jgi:hypothetical protein